MKLIKVFFILLLLLLILVCSVVTLPRYDWCRYIIAFVAMIEMIYLMYCTFDDSVLN